MSRILRFLIWSTLLALVLRFAFDPSWRDGVRLFFGVAAAVGLLRLVLRKRRLGRASPEELDAMTGAEFEDYVAERVRAAGWTPSEILRRGDFGADLVAERAGVRIAVQAKRRSANVGNRAVQEAAAGADFHRCDAALVVTQARFTPAARRQAAATRLPLGLVDRERLTDFARILADLATAVEASRRV